MRYQYFEPNIEATALTADLSYIDYVAIPLSMEAKNALHATNSPQNTVANGQALVNAAAASGLVVNNNVLPSSGAILPSASFARVISPGFRGELYHDWTSYLKSTLPGRTAHLRGCTVGVGPQPTGNPLTQAQSYDFTAAFQGNGDVILTALSGSGSGSAACVPGVQRGTGVGSVNQTVTIKFADLNSVIGVYGNNTPYTVNDNGAVTVTVGIVNDYYGRVVGDLLAGMAFGFPGSAVLFKGTEIGSLSSTEWWGNGNLPDGTFIKLTDSPAGQNIAFDKAQPGQPQNYHTFAASLVGLTPAYGFALQDRLGNNLISFDTRAASDPNGYLLMTIGPDSATVAVTNPKMSIDGPVEGQRVKQPFVTGGWAVELGAAVGVGVDAIHVYAFPVVNGVVGAGRFVNQATLGGARADVGSVYGTQFTNSGFNFLMDGLTPGEYIIGVYVRSTVSGNFNADNPGQTKFVRITIDATKSSPSMSLDGPVEGQQVRQPFVTGGWAIDTGAASGVGVDAIHVWAFPIANGVIGAGRFVDQATLGGGRPDVAAVFGSQFVSAGFNFLMSGLTPGEYILGVYVHSSVSGAFDANNPGQTKFVRITVLQ